MEEDSENDEAEAACAGGESAGGEFHPYTKIPRVGRDFFGNRRSPRPHEISPRRAFAL
jgi:hypothetical protein